MNKVLLFKTIAISVLFTSIPYSALATDAIGKQMDDAFGSLSNVTTPKSYNTARRGVFSGGQIFIKNPTKRITPITVTAPSFSAGCGGIDLYGGSFSYINADQMIETFQAIGSNALGYGLKLAVQAACPTCEQVMTSLEKTAQMINGLNIDSCQAAQGIVDAGVDFATTSQSDIAAKTKLAGKGFAEDFNEAWGWANEESDSPSEALKAKDPQGYAEDITGNITWRSLKQNKASTVFGGNDQYLEMLMTMVGSVIVKNPDENDKEADPKLINLNGYGIKLAEIINGGSFKIYECDSKGENECLSPPLIPTKSITNEGLKKRIEDSLFEVFYAQKNNVEWSNKAKNALSFPTITSAVCLNKIREAAIGKLDDAIGRQIAELCAGRVALEAAYTQVSSNIQTIKSSMLNAGSSDSQKAAKEAAIKTLETNLLNYRYEYQDLGSSIPTNTLYQALQQIKIHTTQTDTLVE